MKEHDIDDHALGAETVTAESASPVCSECGGTGVAAGGDPCPFCGGDGRRDDRVAGTP